MENYKSHFPYQRHKTEQQRKTAKKEQQKKSDKCRINLGKTFVNWEAHKSVCGGSHQDFAKHLLAFHEANCSTYLGVQSQRQEKRPSKRPTLFDVTDEDITDGIQDSPIEKRRRVSASPLLKGLDLALGNDPRETDAEQGPVFSTPFHHCPPPEFDGSDIDEDESFELSDLEVSDVAFDPDWHVPELAREETITGNMTLKMNLQEVRNSPKCIAFNQCLIDLVKNLVGWCCAKCQHTLNFTTSTAGTCLIVRWSCPGQEKYQRGHTKGSWSSQPRFENMWAGNILVPTCLALSGNSYQKVALYSKFLKLGFISRSSFHRVQKQYVVPAVKKFWQESQEKFMKECKEPLVLAGDGRNDSPGFSAKYCTYTLMDNVTKRVVDLQFVDCRQTELKSTNMEKMGFIKGMECVMKDCEVKEVITDANTQIKALLKNDAKYSNIEHQLDMWHVSRNITKKLRAAGQAKCRANILQWIQPITNHLWWCAQNCHGDTKVLKATWSKVLHHVTDQHEWVDCEGLTAGRCSHPIPIPADQEKRAWIKPGSSSHKEVKKVVLELKLMEKMPHLRKFRHTSELELFNAHILMYCPKRHAFGYEGYKLRNVLAALDYNHHLGRPQAKDGNGKPRYTMHFSKASRRWTAQPVPLPKQYEYVDELIFRVLLARIGAETRIAAKVPPSEDNPVNLLPRTATAPQPPKEQLIQEREERDRLKAATLYRMGKAFK